MEHFGRSKTVFALPERGERIVLFFWGESRVARLSNLARINDRGEAVWWAELPGGSDHDCFTALRRKEHGFIASTYGGHVLHLDPRGRPFEVELAPS